VKLNFEFWYAYIIANLFSYLNLLGSVLYLIAWSASEMRVLASARKPLGVGFPWLKSLGQKRFILAAKTHLCWWMQHPPAVLCQHKWLFFLAGVRPPPLNHSAGVRHKRPPAQWIFEIGSK
jgi:hypothetical protein